MSKTYPALKTIIEPNTYKEIFDGKKYTKNVIYNLFVETEDLHDALDDMEKSLDDSRYEAKKTLKNYLRKLYADDQKIRDCLEELKKQETEKKSARKEELQQKKIDDAPKIIGKYLDLLDDDNDDIKNQFLKKYNMDQPKRKRRSKGEMEENEEEESDEPVSKKRITRKDFVDEILNDNNLTEFTDTSGKPLKCFKQWDTVNSKFKFIIET